ncbi:FAD-dependent oxidoreductase [Archangium violaceum]|uniref:flavin-dependent monooxygenase QhpG n=1 Tax=Archangium violaceum TaxID=83451 RepID=UPI002B299D96|nr:FAD-dependent oxidoreductase [Archangium violaceum]
MSTELLETEVCVIGGGPAGSAFARELARRGHRVLLVERHAFPRLHVGESLTPGVWPLLEALELREAVIASGFLPATEARVRWTDDETRVARARASEPGLAVDRGRFDALLLGAAKAVGVTVLQPATASEPRRLARGWEVSVSSGDRALLVRARFLADASGRAFVLGGQKEPTSARTLALYGYWHCAPVNHAETRVEAARAAWFWGSHLPGGLFNAMAFVDPELLRQRGVRKPGLEGFYLELMAGSELLHGLKDARRMGPVIACDATSYADPEPIDDTCIKLGEAGFGIDPLSSSGVQKALQTALCGSVVVHTLLSGRGNTAAALAFYRENQRHSVEQHAAWAGGYYHEHSRYRDEAFWKRRARPATEPPTPALREELSRRPKHRVRLAEGAALIDTPCIVGEYVELRRALNHPSLARPVAYLGGVELAPLLECLGDGRTIQELLRAWTRWIPPDRGLAIAGWLHRQGLLVGG